LPWRFRVDGSWIWKKNSSDLAIAGLAGIEDDLDRLGVVAVVAVGGVGHLAAAIADAGRDHAGLAADQILHAPEAAAGEHGAFPGHRISSSWSIRRRRRTLRNMVGARAARNRGWPHIAGITS
jgi:hypothetical protein